MLGLRPSSVWSVSWPYAAVFAAGFATACALYVFYQRGAGPAHPTPPALNLDVPDNSVHRVREVVDGDTLALENGLHVRVAGINAPESGRWVHDPAPLAEQSTARARELAQGRRVRLVLADPPMDAHGRLIACVYLAPENGAETDLASVLLREGLARAMGLGLPREERERLTKIEQEAKAAKVGVWALIRAGGAATPSAPLTYCAASGGQVFHLSTCAQAARISPAHLVQYRTLAEATATGRRPCSQCLKNGAPEKGASPPAASEDAIDER